MGKPFDYSIFKEIFEKEYTITRSLYRNVLRWPKHAAIIDPFRDKALTHGEWNEISNQFANALLDAGVVTYDSIMGDLFNTYEWFVVLMGAAKARGKFVAQNFNLPEGQISKLIDDDEIVVFVYDSDLKDMVVKAIEMAKFKPKVVVMCGPGEVPPGHVSFEKFIEGKSKEPPVTEKDVNWLDPVLGLYTSGTTGLPKGFTLNHGIIYFDNMMMAAQHKIDSECVNLATTPLFHRGGNTLDPIPMLHCGGTVVVMRSFNENLALDYVEKYKVTNMATAPTVLERMCAAQEKKPRDLKTLRTLVSMGAPLSTEQSLRFMKLCPNIYNSYGTADLHCTTHLMPWQVLKKPGTIGLSLTEDIVKLVRIDRDHRGNPEDPADECPKDGVTEGEVAMRTIHGTYGYINRPEDEAKAFPYRGWQLPGDTGTWDEDGFITIRGRMDDMIITGAENVHPVVVENALKTHPAMIDTFVIGVPSKMWGQAIVAYVSLKDPTIKEKDLDEFCKNHPGLARYQRPKYYKIVDYSELPFNPSGKKLYYKMKERARIDFPNLP